MKLRQAKKIIKRVGGLTMFTFIINHIGNPISPNKTPSEVKAYLIFLRHVLRWKRKLHKSYF